MPASVLTSGCMERSSCIVDFAVVVVVRADAGNVVVGVVVEVVLMVGIVVVVEVLVVTGFVS